MSRADSASKTKLITLRPASNFSRSSCSTRSLSATESRRAFTRLSRAFQIRHGGSDLASDAKLQLLAGQTRLLQLGLGRLNLALPPAAVEERERDVYANHPVGGGVARRGHIGWTTRAAACRLVGGNPPGCSSRTGWPKREDRCAARRTFRADSSARSLAADLMVLRDQLRPARDGLSQQFAFRFGRNRRFGETPACRSTAAGHPRIP